MVLRRRRVRASYLSKRRNAGSRVGTASRRTRRAALARSIPSLSADGLSHSHDKRRLARQRDGVGNFAAVVGARWWRDPKSYLTQFVASNCVGGWVQEIRRESINLQRLQLNRRSSRARLGVRECRLRLEKQPTMFFALTSLPGRIRADDERTKPTRFRRSILGLLNDGSRRSIRHPKDGDVRAGLTDGCGPAGEHDGTSTRRSAFL